jgi:hypothetical protein
MEDFFKSCWILDGTVPRHPTTLEEFNLAHMAIGSRIVQKDIYKDSEVSTVLLPISLDEFPRFETMVFGGKHDLSRTQSSTYDQAKQIHLATLEKVMLE